jgi:hypothetical protein
VGGRKEEVKRGGEDRPYVGGTIGLVATVIVVLVVLFLPGIL